MKRRLCLNILVFIALLIFLPEDIFSQGRKKSLPSSSGSKTSEPDKAPQNVFSNTYSPEEGSKPETTDSVSIKADGIEKGKTSGGLDTIVTYTAKDTVRFRVKKKSMYLRGDAKLDMGNSKIEAESITLDFDKSLLHAKGMTDTNNRGYGFPKFNDNGENFVGSDILFNFKTKKGTISLGETELSEGFYFGSKIKRVSEDDLFIQDGCYTTCDSPHPHFYFGSPKMKVIAKDRVFLDPLIFYVEDMPIFAVPFGLFFPSKSGRQSGIIIPSFLTSQTRGVIFRNIGLYLALSDYYDTKFTADLFSKNWDYTIRNYTQWKLTDVFSGNINLSYGKSSYGTDDNSQKTTFSANFRHNHTITPYDKIVANLSYSNAQHHDNLFNDPNKRAEQLSTSNASYTKSFQNGASFSLGYGITRNFREETHTQNATLNYSLPNMSPFKSLISPQSWVPSWVRDINFRYGVKMLWNENKDKEYLSTDTLNDGTVETNYAYPIESQRRIEHSPSISISPKLGYFTLTPTIGFGMNHYFRRLTRTYSTEDSTLHDSFESGFFTEYKYNFGATLTTKLFGILQPDIFGLKAIRHTFQPSITYNYTPDMSGENYNFYGSYTDRLGKEQVYSRFLADGGGIASRRESQQLSYNITNKFDAKVAKGDSVVKTDLLTWTLYGNYDFTRDSLKFSDISMSFRTPNIGKLSMNTSANFTLYDEAMVYDEYQDDYVQERVNQFLLSNSKGIARLTNFNLTLGTTVSSEGLVSNDDEYRDIPDSTEKDSAGLGTRFMQRMNTEEETFDFYGDNTPGYSHLNLPWSLRFNLNFNYSEPLRSRITRRLTLQSTFNMSITNTWKLTASATYDFINRELLSPNLNITKDLHCWELSLRWYPSGYNKGFYLRFGIKAPHLQDLKIEKQNTSLYY